MEYEKIWKKYSQTELKKLEKLNAEYIDFLSNGKTERECVDQIVNLAEAAGYVQRRNSRPETRYIPYG